MGGFVAHPGGGFSPLWQKPDPLKLGTGKIVDKLNCFWPSKCLTTINKYYIISRLNYDYRFIAVTSKGEGK